MRHAVGLLRKRSSDKTELAHARMLANFRTPSLRQLWSKEYFRMKLFGSCHCGALCNELVLPRAPEELNIRACTCSFCRAHGARTVSDPEGRAIIRVQNASNLQRYRFALNTADFFICANCGVYIGAVAYDGDIAFSTTNVNVLQAHAEFSEHAEPVCYDGETSSERLARRRRQWTPTTIDSHKG